MLLAAFSIRGFGMLACVLRVLLGLDRVLLTLGVVVLAVRLGSGAMGTSPRTRDVPPLCCVRLSCCFLLLVGKFRRTQLMASIVSVRSGYCVISERGCRIIGRLDCSIRQSRALRQ